MSKKNILSQDQESLADVLFPDREEFEEAILSIPPEKRVLRTEQYDFSVSSLISMMEKTEVVIPEFQRRYVWTERQASRLIESLIIQCPIPVIYLNQEKDETFSVIDGNQRLNSLRRFVDDKFALVGLTSYPELSGLTFSQLDVRFQRHISNRVLRCTVILKETHPQVKFDVFERLNSGAVALTRQELRHGLYFGPLLKRAAEVASKLMISSHFSARKDKRMKAEELVIRFWALDEGLGSYEQPLASFITAFADSNRSLGDLALGKLVMDIETAYGRSKDLFGSLCFSYSQEAKPKFNAAVFDAQMIACSRLSDPRFHHLSGLRDEVQAGYVELQKDRDYARSVTLATSNKASLQGRIHKVSALLKSIQ